MTELTLLTQSSINGQIIEKFSNYGISTSLNTHSIDFIIKKIIGEHISGGSDLPGAWLYEDKNCNTTTDFNEAESFLTGNIKWDGCSNWNFHTDDCMKHFCGRKDAVSIGELMNHLYQIASERMIRKIFS